MKPAVFNCTDAAYYLGLREGAIVRLAREGRFPIGASGAGLSSSRPSWRRGCLCCPGSAWRTPWRPSTPTPTP
jgi:hypothetical protein